MLINKQYRIESARASKREDGKRHSFIHCKVERFKSDVDFDIVFMSHVIEHIDKNKIDFVLKYLNAREYQNVYQVHKVLVTEEMLREYGFNKVYTS